MNSITLTGRLTKAPVMAVSANGTKTAKFTLAVYDTKEHTNFIQCTAFNKTADIIDHRGAKKGTYVVVNGKWQTGSYEHDGRTVYTNDCIVFSVDVPQSEPKESTEQNPSYEWENNKDIPF